MVELHVYVSETCWACEEARSIVADISGRFPEVHIELRDLSDERRPSRVFATPTYVLDGQTIYLGNPTREELAETLVAADGKIFPGG
jgi:hypothetical protein